MFCSCAAQNNCPDEGLRSLLIDIKCFQLYCSLLKEPQRLHRGLNIYFYVLTGTMTPQRTSNEYCDEYEHKSRDIHVGRYSGIQTSRNYETSVLIYINIIMSLHNYIDSIFLL